MLMLIFVSCTKKISNSIAIDKRFNIEINTPNCGVTSINNQMMKGEIDCQAINMTYEYGFVSPGPLSLKEEFRSSFNAIYKRRFFRDRMIDPKVYNIFLDSVKVLNVKPIEGTDSLMFQCSGCNVVAKLKFMGDIYNFPVTMGENQLQKKESSFEFYRIDDFIYKVYYSDISPPSLYIRPAKNTFKRKKAFTIKVLDTSLTCQDLIDVLKTIRVSPFIGK